MYILGSFCTHGKLGCNSMHVLQLLQYNRNIQIDLCIFGSSALYSRVTHFTRRDISCVQMEVARNFIKLIYTAKIAQYEVHVHTRCVTSAQRWALHHLLPLHPLT